MTCPKCSAKIKRFDLAPNCKKCGVHILYYTQEEDLARDAKRTELEFASARAFALRLKASYISGKTAVARLVLTLLGIAALILPLGRITVSLPFFDTEVTLGGLGIYKIVSDKMLTVIPDFLSSGIGDTFKLSASYVCFFVYALCVLGLFVSLALSFVNIKKSAAGQCVFSVLAIVFVLAAEVFTFMSSHSADNSELLTVSPVIWGTALSVAVYASLFVPAFLIYKNPPQYTISDTDKKRIALFRDIKAGKVSYDDLPVPIFETDEERQNRENALAGIKKEKKSRKAADEK